MVDFVGIFEHLRIPYWTSGKNVPKNCVNIQCPCPGCNDRSNHYYANTVTGTGRCWKCKGTYPAQAIAWAAHIPIDEARKLIEHYTSGENVKPIPQKPVYAQSLELPGGPLEEMHRKYLLGRGLDPDFLVRYYDIRGTKLFTKWHDKDYWDYERTKNWTGGFIFNIRPDIAFDINEKHTIAVTTEYESIIYPDSTSRDKMLVGFFWRYKSF